MSILDLRADEVILRSAAREMEDSKPIAFQPFAQQPSSLPSPASVRSPGNRSYASLQALTKSTMAMPSTTGNASTPCTSEPIAACTASGSVSFVSAVGENCTALAVGGVGGRSVCRDVEAVGVCSACCSEHVLRASSVTCEASPPQISALVRPCSSAAAAAVSDHVVAMLQPMVDAVSPAMSRLLGKSSTESRGRRLCERRLDDWPALGYEGQQSKGK